jgi:HEAT repeat protein
MSSSDGDPLRSPAGGKSYGSLPPVEPPTATFILQLFLIPLTIVSIVVLLWLTFSWLAHMGRDDPAALVRDLKKFDQSSWQRAYELADLLRSPDPRYDKLRQDPQLAKQLSEVLLTDLDAPVTSGTQDEVRNKRRMFLARALGSFEVPDVIPALVRAAEQERSPGELQVRLSALEALAVLADKLGPKTLRDNPEVMQVVLEASKASDQNDETVKDSDGEPTAYRPHSELRSVAAYTLGVIGGDTALERLQRMQSDAYASARYNAGTGLARNGDPRAVRTLKEMLDPENELSAKDEGSERDRDRKRVNVVQAGIQSTVVLAQANPDADIAPLIGQLQRLTDDEMTLIKSDRTRLQTMAREALDRLGEKNKAEAKRS